MAQEQKELRISKKHDKWHCELWIEIMDSKMFDFEDEVTAIDFQTLLVEIGNKNWIDLLNK
jgi:hypothetical protein